MHTRRVEDLRAKRKSRDAKRARSFDECSIKNRLEIQDKPKFKKWFSNQVLSKFSNASDDKGNNPRAQKGRSGNSPNENPTCSMCPLGECLVGTGNCFRCVKCGQKMRFFRNMKGQDRGGQAQSSGSSDAPKKNRLYALLSRSEQDTSPGVVTVC